MNRLCDWGMHLPGARKVFHRGHLFTRCADCDATLMASHKGWHPVPIGQRVTWRERTAEDKFFAVSKNSQRERLRFSPVAALRRRFSAAAG